MRSDRVAVVNQTRRLGITEWNKVLLDWFFPAEGPRPAFLYSSAAEIQRINVSCGLQLGDPVEDLVHAAQLYESWPMVNSYPWSKQGALCSRPAPISDAPSRLRAGS